MILHKIQMGFELLLVFLAIHWQPFFGTIAAIIASVYWVSKLKLDVVDKKHEGSWVKFIKSIFIKND